MFEQSILAGHPANRGAGFLVSLGVQSAIVAIGILAPLLYTNNLPFVQLTSPPTVPLAPRPPAAAKAVQRSSAITATSSQVFVPPRIPETIAVIHDAPGEIAAPPGDLGVPGGMGSPPQGDALAQLLDRGKPIVPPVRAEIKQAPKPPRQISVSEGVQAAMLIRKVLPVYPRIAIQARVSGTVQLIGIIGKDGTIQNLRVIGGPALLVNAALDAVKQWAYRPTLLNGEPVEVICPISVTFTLN
jgi:protein TonB